MKREVNSRANSNGTERNPERYRVPTGHFATVRVVRVAFALHSLHELTTRARSRGSPVRATCFVLRHVSRVLQIQILNHVVQIQILMDIDSAPCEIDLEPSSWLPSTSTLIYLIQQRFRAKAEAPTLIRWRRQLPD